MGCDPPLYLPHRGGSAAPNDVRSTPMSTTPHSPAGLPAQCSGQCERAKSLDEAVQADPLMEFTSQAHPTTCEQCAPEDDLDLIATPEVTECLGCEARLGLSAQPTLEEATTDPADRLAVPSKDPQVCQECADDGFVAPKPQRRRDVVIENCEFYLANGIGLTEAAEREGYSDRSHLDSVLRRWRRLDLTHALGALDPDKVRERP